jgi:hypothetical protein
MRLENRQNESSEFPKPDSRKRLSRPITVLKADNSNGPKTFFGYVKNISRSGMMIGTTNPRELGTKYRLEIPFPEPVNVTAVCDCEVVWTKVWEKGRCHDPGMGLRFLDLPAEVASAIEDWIQRETMASMLLN